MRFISELPTARRDELLYSVQVQPAPSDVSVYEKQKIDFLYDTRNQFTHRAEARGSLGRVFSPYLALLEDGKLKFGYTPIARDKGGTITYGVRRWPFVLYEIVAGHIGEPLPDFSVACTVIVTTKSGVDCVMHNRRYRELADPAYLQELAEAHHAQIRQSKNS